MHYHQLTEQERYQIYIMKNAGHNQKAIALLLNRSPSTISRELSPGAERLSPKAGPAVDRPTPETGAQGL